MSQQQQDVASLRSAVEQMRGYVPMQDGLMDEHGSTGQYLDRDEVLALFAPAPVPAVPRQDETSGPVTDAELDAAHQQYEGLIQSAFDLGDVIFDRRVALREVLNAFVRSRSGRAEDVTNREAGR